MPRTRRGEPTEVDDLLKTPEQWHQLSVESLRLKCGDYGLHIKGCLKKDLVTRLMTKCEELRQQSNAQQRDAENKDPNVANDANAKSEEGVKFNRVVLNEQAVDIGDLLLQQIREFKSFRSEFNTMKERQNQYESHVDCVMEVQLRNEDAFQRDRSKELQQLQLQQQQQFELKQ